MQAVMSHVHADVATAHSAERAMERKPVLADRYKTRMCRNYEDTGRCPYEFKCMFAHGEAELRTTEMNIEDGLVTEEAIKAFQRQLTLKKQAQQSPEGTKRAPVGKPLAAGRQQHPGVYAHQPYVMPTAHYPAMYSAYYGPCQCAECVGYVAPQPPASAEGACQCPDCLAYYKQYGYASHTPATAVMEP